MGTFLRDEESIVVKNLLPGARIVDGGPEALERQGDAGRGPAQPQNGTSALMIFVLIEGLIKMEVRGQEHERATATRAGPHQPRDDRVGDDGTMF